MAVPSPANTPREQLSGIDFTQTYAISTSTPEIPAAPFNVGEIAKGENGSEYMFVKASTAISAYQVVAIDKTLAAAVPATVALVAQQQSRIGFAQVAIAAGSYGWVAIRGSNIGVLSKKGSLANANLYISSTSPGSATSTSVRTSALLAGVILTTSATSVSGYSTNGSPVVAVASWPRARV